MRRFEAESLLWPFKAMSMSRPMSSGPKTSAPAVTFCTMKNLSGRGTIRVLLSSIPSVAEDATKPTSDCCVMSFSWLGHTVEQMAGDSALKMVSLTMEGACPTHRTPNVEFALVLPCRQPVEQVAGISRMMSMSRDADAA